MVNWTKEAIPDLTGKVFVVTGANSGIGYQCSLALAEKGATVVMACRNLERGQAALDAIRGAAPKARLELMELDLANLESIRAFAEAFRSKHKELHALINNGGPVVGGYSLTNEGFESHFGVNHLGHFALTGLLLDVLKETPSSRIVTLSSRMHAKAEMNLENLMDEQDYNAANAYSRSKLANLLFTFELSRRLKADGKSPMAVAAHPGTAQTSWVENNFSGLMKIVGKLINLSYQSAEMGALPVLFAAVDAKAKPGGYYGPENDTKGYPVELRASEAAYNEKDANHLWELSERLTGVQYKL